MKLHVRSALLLWTLHASATVFAQEVVAGRAWAADGHAPADTPAASPSALKSEQILVKAKRLLLKAQNPPSAATELGPRQISAAGGAGNTASLLRQAPFPACRRRLVSAR